MTDNKRLVSAKIKEVTTVTGWDEKGRIKTFEKVAIEEPPPVAASSEQLAAIYAKLDRGEPITKEERWEVLAEECVRIQKKVFGAMNDERASHDNPVQYTQGAHNAVREAVSMLIGEVMALSLVHSDKRQALEQRILKLEEELRSLSQARGPRLVSDGAGLRAGRAS